MTYDSQDELLSAYIDGELDAAEQAHVEKLLAESAEFRQLHDELCAMRTSLKALFRHRLPEDRTPRGEHGAILDLLQSHNPRAPTSELARRTAEPVPAARA